MSAMFANGMLSACFLGKGMVEMDTQCVNW